MSNTFIPGIELSRRFYNAIVGPALQAAWPNLAYAAALIGPGSEVLGFDTPLSTDHDWGPALQIFLPDASAAMAPAILAAIEAQLPETFAGYPVGVPHGVDLIDQGMDEPPPHHRVRVVTLRQYMAEMLDHPLGTPLDTADWLTIPAQRLGELTSGIIHYDAVGELTQLREDLAFYPRDVWLYLMAAGWARIGQEDHLLARAGSAGDELGSALIGSRLVRDLMQLAFLIERRYPPYPKWFGSAFGRLQCAAQLTPLLAAVQAAADWPSRMTALASAAGFVIECHNRLQISVPIDPTPVAFFSRPFLVAPSAQVQHALIAAIEGAAMRRIAANPPIGSIDQWSDNTDLRSNIGWRRQLRALYE
ncbi:MAG TPA: DUF4037 domain-containing protein [Roseiflexaceae bacterium]|nr:DUF4037 domain-containing protein [Roseiflexaceae bacterium]